ncbi:hypothetical protein [Microbacterium sp. No. 7]|nr:hypothetical protein [Microbacterium sp. No. 7]
MLLLSIVRQPNIIELHHLPLTAQRMDEAIQLRGYGSSITASPST